MAETTLFTIGADVGCTDGICGKLSRLVIDPGARSVTHLVVEDCQLQGRLAPASLVDADAVTGQIRLRCTIAEFEKLDPASKTMLLEGPGADPDVRDQNQLQLARDPGHLLTNPPSVTYDTLPSGQVAVRRGDHVHATGCDIGQIQGLVIDSGSHRVTHLLLEEGHVFGRKVAAIPDRRRNESQPGRHPAQHHQAACEGPAARLASITRALGVALQQP